MLSHWAATSCALIVCGCLVLAPDQVWAQASACAGGETIVQRGDTLSRIADRCDASESTILAANAGLQGSADLQVGETVRVTSADGSAKPISERLNAFGTEANEALGRVAGRVGSSVQDLLDKNPDPQIAP